MAKIVSEEKNSTQTKETTIETCGICLGTIKQGAPITRCECNKVYHQTCAERVEACPTCGKEFKQVSPRKHEEPMAIEVKGRSQRNVVAALGVVIAIGLIISYFVTLATVVIRDSETDDYVNGAKVYLDGEYKGSTDSYGKLKISWLPGGYHTVRVEKDGYYEINERTYVKSDILLNLEPILKTRTLILTDYESNNYITGASVYLDDIKKGTTDSSGEIKIEVSNGNYKVKITTTNYEYEESSISVDSKNKRIAVSLKKYYTLTVIAKDSDTYNYLSGASIYVGGYDKGTTNSYGEKEIKVLKGSHTVKVTKSGYYDASQQVYVDSNKDVTLYLQPFTLSVIAKDSNTYGYLSGASIYVDGYDKGTTNSYGEKKIKGIFGSHTVKVTKSGYYDASQEVYVDSDKGIEIYLKPRTYTVTVNVYSKRFGYLRGVTVYMDGYYRGATDYYGRIDIPDVSKNWHIFSMEYDSSDASKKVYIDADGWITLYGP